MHVCACACACAFSSLDTQLPCWLGQPTRHSVCERKHSPDARWVNSVRSQVLSAAVWRRVYWVQLQCSFCLTHTHNSDGQNRQEPVRCLKQFLEHASKQRDVIICPLSSAAPLQSLNHKCRTFSSHIYTVISFTHPSRVADVRLWWVNGNRCIADQLLIKQAMPLFTDVEWIKYGEKPPQPPSPPPLSPRCRWSASCRVSPDKTNCLSMKSPVI